MFKRKEESPSTEALGNRSNGFFSWMMEFSKKIIFYTFLIYIAIHVFIVVMTAIDYFRSGNMQCLDTLIMEINTTFRDVIGGYIIKATVENVSKYSGTLLEKILEIQIEKLSFIKEKDNANPTETEEDIVERDGILWRRQ